MRDLTGWLKRGNIYPVFAYRMILIMLLFSLSRAGFFLFNHRMFPGVDISQFLTMMKGGFVFDLSAVVYINMLYILLIIVPFDFRYRGGYETMLKYVFLITNGIALAISGMDYVYYRFIGKRATAEVFQTFSNEEHISKMFFRFLIDYWQATLFTMFLIVLMVFLYIKVKVVKPEPKGKIRRFMFSFLMMPVVAALVIGAARGGYKHSTRPITISNATKYVENPQNVAVVLNTPFSLLRTYDKKALTRYRFFDEQKLTRLYNPHYVPSGSKSFIPDNVIIIILESFAREYIGSLNPVLEGGKYEGYTPFIDSLVKVGLTFDVSVSNGRKSIDAMPSILASIPSLETPYIISHYANNQINGLPFLLRKKGYYSAFFHGAPNGSMGFDSFAKLAGFEDYFGLNEYPDKSDFDGMWGVWDEPFLQFFASKLNTFRQPFIASIFTVSSHHPFEVPVQYKGKFKKGPAPICEVVGYSDYSLRRFFNTISKNDWYNNTLFVITADHTNESVHTEYQNDYGVYSIPIILYKPGSELKGMKKRIAQQIDIMPTVLNYLGYDDEFIAFGNDLLDDSGESFAFNTNGSNYHLYMRDHLLEMTDMNLTGFFNYKSDTFLKDNLLGKEPDLQNEMQEKLKAIIQTYNSRLLDNNMTIKK
ncbi:MAG TPA: sulfatase-like hydrolase/transferase [Bacteroidales bacterium]|nr:sulfatase-like hydrolase/transferase [Bacteroidales bacterium]